MKAFDADKWLGRAWELAREGEPLRFTTVSYTPSNDELVVHIHPDATRQQITGRAFVESLLAGILTPALEAPRTRELRIVVANRRLYGGGRGRLHYHPEDGRQENS